MRFVLKLLFIAFLAAVVVQQVAKNDAPNTGTKAPAVAFAAPAISAPAPPRKVQAGPLRVQITAQSDGADHPTVSGTTNLPDGSSLMVSLRRPQAKYFAEAKATVMNSAFTAGPFSASGAAVPPGDYEIEITFPLAFTQPPAVQEVVGRNNENLTGPLVVKSKFGVTAGLKTKTKVGGGSSAKADAKSRTDTEAQLKRWKEENELKNRWPSQVLLLRSLRNSMKNPKSFELETAVELPDGTVCVTYRATNSFNAIIPGRAILSLTGKSVTSDDREKFPAHWNATCAKQSGKDIKFIRQAL